MSIDHLKGDMSPTRDEYNEALANSRSVIQKFKENVYVKKNKVSYQAILARNNEWLGALKPINFARLQHCKPTS